MKNKDSYNSNIE